MVPSPLRNGLFGFHDRLWRIEGPNFVAGLTEYNNELTGYAPILTGVFGKNVVRYGGNAYFVLNEARKRGFKVEAVSDRS